MKIEQIVVERGNIKQADTFVFCSFCSLISEFFFSDTKRISRMNLDRRIHGIQKIQKQIWN